MKVQFDFSLDDLVDTAERTTARSGVVRSLRWRGMAITCLFSGLIAYVVRPGTTATKLALAVIAAIVAAIIYPVASAQARKRRLRTLFREQFGSSGPFTCEVELTPTGVVSTQAGTRTNRDWSRIAEVKDAADAIEFVTRGSGTVVVRNRAFQSPDQRRQFLELARSYVSASRAIGQAVGTRKVSSGFVGRL